MFNLYRDVVHYGIFYAPYTNRYIMKTTWDDFHRHTNFNTIFYWWLNVGSGIRQQGVPLTKPTADLLFQLLGCDL